ncbi:MAG: hypothetical protein JSS82_12530 [Bacteroidetes bacterium]|nr:hypothetical protein [Bacteroidota bacterium]
MDPTFFLAAVLAVFIHHAYAFNLNTSLANSGINGVSCFPNSNQYQLTFANAFPINIDATVVFDCSGFDAVSFSANLPAFNGSALQVFQLLSPVTIANNLCVISLYFPNPFSPGDQVLIGEPISNQCGSQSPDAADGYTEGCSYVNYFCMISNGFFYRYAPFLLTICLVFLVLYVLTRVLVVVFSNNLVLSKLVIVPTRSLPQKPAANISYDSRINKENLSLRADDEYPKDTETTSLTELDAPPPVPSRPRIATARRRMTTIHDEP